MSTRTRQLVRRALVTVIVGAACAICLSSSLFAAIVGSTTVTIVVWDVLAHRAQPLATHAFGSAPRSPSQPLTLNVDLTNRRR